MEKSEAPARARAPVEVFETTGTPGRLALNIMHFARTLRAAGMPVGPGHVLRAMEAVRTVGIGRRDDFYWALFSVFVARREHKELFDQAFHIFWKDPRLLERLMQMLLPQIRPDENFKQTDQPNRRLAEALAPQRLPGQGEDEGELAEEEIELDMSLTWSDKELLQKKDFEQMSADELEEAKREIARLRLPIVDVPTRRFRADALGSRVDMRKTLRNSLRGGGAAIDLARKERVRRHPPLVVMCDISGSMARYSRMLLLFMHAITNDRDRVHSFLFGTRLTNVTRALRARDVDVALDKIGKLVDDWEGGTRIGHTLAEFNRRWSRRVLGQGAMVLLITDGLDRDAGDGLEEEMERLHKSCRRLIWLNPLLRYDGYEPISKGAQAMIRHVDELRSVHSLSSLKQLTQVLSQEGQRRPESVDSWVKRARKEAA
ncbi:MAG TPA: VWA domain-containing protein [Geminicoccus sp.]|uniref:vWA domain-containing protein n=1 Tax=Geminicoccus sp. TaxID=2024832 RepID=UPI002CED9D2B|nr:VWA domain-containing protein [Geminicoccus sp.]HWL68370.1 VWA domain-containing protein [Geminicoccus sp.]